MESTFPYFWDLVKNHGSVADLYRCECEKVWRTYSLEQQRAIYRAIRDKFQTRKFVHYNPLKAIMDNAPKRTRQELSFDDYYHRYHTTDERDGWKRVFISNEQRTVYIKS